MGEDRETERLWAEMRDKTNHTTVAADRWAERQTRSKVFEGAELRHALADAAVALLVLVLALVVWLALR